MRAIGIKPHRPDEFVARARYQRPLFQERQQGPESSEILFGMRSPELGDTGRIEIDEIQIRPPYRPDCHGRGAARVRARASARMSSNDDALMPPSNPSVISA